MGDVTRILDCTLVGCSNRATDGRSNESTSDVVLPRRPLTSVSRTPRFLADDCRRECWPCQKENVSRASQGRRCLKEGNARITWVRSPVSGGAFRSTKALFFALFVGERARARSQ